VLKAVPLLFLLSGILAGRRSTYQWASLLILPYLLEGVTRAITDGGAMGALALLEALLALVFFGAAAVFVRHSAAMRRSHAATAAD
ncbi:MAG: DUF2069 domain-containing protein, partial [Rhodocyclaceae bacterium]|nr:DUF2069 domain-containing protein [Rhodocyclaceae bacterium]